MSEKITLNQIIEELSNSTGKTTQTSHDFITGLTELIKSGAVEDGKASITNFGSFSVIDVAERQGVNPQTGESITIPAHQRLTFTPFKALEKQVNLPYSHLESTVVEDEPEKSAPEPKAEKPSLPEKEPTSKLEKKPASPKAEPEPTEPMKPKEEKSEPKVYKRPGRPERSSGNTITALIFILVILVVAIGVWWFMLRDTGQPQTAQNTPAQQETPEEQAPATPEESEITQPENPVSTDTQTPETNATPETVDGSESTELNQETSSDQISPTTASNTEIPSTYQVIGGEWFYDIARKVYGRPALWPLIFEANYSVEQDPDRLQPGPVLNIPALEGSPTNLTDADLTSLSDAIMTVSNAYKNAGKDEAAEAYAKMANKYQN